MRFRACQQVSMVRCGNGIDPRLAPGFGGVEFLESFSSKEDSDAPQVSTLGPSPGRRAGSFWHEGGRSWSATFAMSEATVYNWLRQEQTDRGEISGTSTDRTLDLATAKRRVPQFDTELAVSRRVNEVFLGAAPSRRGRPGKGTTWPRLPLPRGHRVGYNAWR